MAAEPPTNANAHYSLRDFDNEVPVEEQVTGHQEGEDRDIPVFDFLVHELRPVAEDSPQAYFPAPAAGYRFQNTGHTDKQAYLRAAKILGIGNAPVVNRRPDTKEYFEGRGSVVKPADGDNAMREQDKCLTCINQGGSCAGTRVREGKCDNCTGVWIVQDGVRRRKRNQRLCRWKDPAAGVWTYNQAQDAAHGLRIPQNRAEAVKLRGLRMADLTARIGDFGLASFELRILGWLAAGVIDGWGGMVYDDVDMVLDAMVEMTVRRISFVQNSTIVVDQGTRGQFVAALDEILVRLLATRMSDNIIEPLDLRRMLPESHPSQVLRSMMVRYSIAATGKS